MKNRKTRNYIFVINNYTPEDVERLKTLGASLERHKFMCFGLEIAPETGTPHIQGYIQLDTSQQFSFLQKYFNLTRNGELLKFHIEPANGTHEENITYSKKDGDYHEFGTPTKQGERTDLATIKQKVKEDPKNLVKIVDENVTNLQQLKFAQGLQPYYLPQRDPRQPPKCFWIFGSAGIGKTKLVYDTFKDVCAVSNCDWLGTGYAQQECFLVDDFRVGDISFNMLLRITDRYPFMLYFKGGQVPFNSPFIVFTSPHSIDKTFTVSHEDLRQLKRRVTEINLAAIKDVGAVDLRNLDPKQTYDPRHDCDSDW